MTDYDKAKMYSALMAWLMQCYEFFSNTESPQKASIILDATKRIGDAVLDLCLSHATDSDEIIPRFRFTELPSLDVADIIKTLTRFADSEDLKEFCPEVPPLLALVAMDTLRAQRINETPTEVYNIEETLKGIK